MTDAPQPELLPCLSEGTLAELERLYALAARGPWYVATDINERPQILAAGTIRVADFYHPPAGNGEAAALLCATLHSALPALLAMARRSVPGEPSDEAIEAIRCVPTPSILGKPLERMSDEDRKRICRAVYAHLPSRSVPERGGETHPVFAFLLGSGPLDGVWYGDDPPTGKPRFWWRSHLRAALGTSLVYNKTTRTIDKAEGSASKDSGEAKE